MITAAVVTGIVCVTVLIGFSGYVAVRCFSQSAEIARVLTGAHTATLDTLTRIHDRNTIAYESMADRFMAVDFVTFKSYQLAGSADEGSFEEPEAEVRVLRPDSRGGLTTVGVASERQQQAAADEERILSQDFPEELLTTWP